MNDNGGTAGVRRSSTPACAAQGHAVAGRHAGGVVLALAGHAASRPTWTALAAHIDFFPTLAEIAGAKLTDAVKEQVEGRSLVPLLREPEGRLARPRSSSRTSAAGRKGRSRRSTSTPIAACAAPRWHLVCDARAGKKQWQLFDVKADPGEKTDVAAEHPEVVKELDAAYDKWWDSVQP